MARAAQQTPEAPALVCGERRWSYAELADQTTRLAWGLRELGVRRGDRVAIHLDNDGELVVALLAALRIGAAFVMINPTTKQGKLHYLLRDSGARVVVLPAGKVPLLEAASDLSELRAVVAVGSEAPTLPGRTVRTLAGLLEEGRADLGFDPVIDLDLAALLYTSGTTGEPKGVMLTHRNIAAATDAIVEYLRLTSQDVLFNVLPLSFGYGLTQLFSVLRQGARLVLEKGMVYPHVTLTRMASEGATGFAMVPTIASVLLGMDLGKYDLRRLRYVTNAGAALPTEHTRRFRAALPHVDLVLMYGQTECLRISYLEPDQVDRRPDSVGKGMPNQELLVLDTQGEEVPPGVVGELVVRGSHATCGYWNQPQLTERKLRAGRYPGERMLLTGDLFRRDEEGYLYFVGRQDDIIKCKGEKVSPHEVEDVLYAHPGVAEAAVVGVSDPVLGQAVKAVVVLRPGFSLTAREVRGHCALRLEDFMVPAIVEFREELPKTPTGKIQKQELGDARPARSI